MKPRMPSLAFNILFHNFLSSIFLQVGKVLIFLDVHTDQFDFPTKFKEVIAVQFSVF